MSWYHRLFRRARAEAELNEEIRFYLDQETQLRIGRGQSPEEAMQAARRDFGNVTLVKETTRQMWGWTLVEDVVRDLRHSLRLLARSPLFTAVAVMSLALGIGANTAIFSLADAIIFRNLPVREPQHLVQVRAVHPHGVDTIHSYPMYEDIRDRNQVFSSTVSACSWASIEPIALVLPNESRRDLRARLTAASGNYFDTLGVEPVIGRTFTPDEDRAPGAHPVAVVSYRFWKRELRADPGIVNTRLLHNGVTYQILGVTPPSFTGISSNDDPDIWVPMMMVDALLAAQTIKNPNTSSLYVFGRLKAGLSAANASADIARIYSELQPHSRNLQGRRGEVVPMAKGVQTLRSRFEKPLLILLSIVGLLLLIACANLAALLMARASARRHEIAIRLSLGASRLRLLRQFLTESLLIGVLGGAAGLAVSGWGASLLIGMVTQSTRRLPVHFTVDTRVLAFTAALSILAAILFGLLPALQANRTRIAQGSTTTSRHSRLPGGPILIAGQMALSLFLLVAAGLFVRSLANLRYLDTGFVRENVLVLMLDPHVAYRQDIEKYLAMYRQLIERIEALPGVRSASGSSATFFGGSRSGGNITYEGHAGQVPKDEEPTKVRVTPRFMETLGLSLLAGRTFTERDDRKASQVAIVSESIARRYFPSANPIGKRFCFDSQFHAKNAIEIVGVVRDVRYSNLREASPYTLYFPLQQSPSPRFDLQVRTLANPVAMAAQVQEAVRRFDPGVRVVHTVTLERLVEDSIAQDRLLALLAGFFAVLALMLSAIGLYGITSYGVHRRTSEIGVRIALGASSRDVQWMVLREVLVLVVAGASVGIPAALAAAGIVSGLLFGVTPADPLTIAGAAITLILIALMAGYLPARRACRVDPMQALRSE
jgi:predicted permease